MKNRRKYVARHGVGMRSKSECCDLLPEESVLVVEYEMVATPTHKNDERRSRKPHEMEAQVVVAQSWKCVG